MFLRQMPKLLLTALMLPGILPALSQVVPHGEQGELPLVIGAGISDYRLDFGYDALGHRRPIYGGTLWVDYSFYKMPALLRGLGLEFEATDLHFAGPIELSAAQNPFEGGHFGMRHDTAEGGAIYKYHHLRRFVPYGKFLVGFGSMDFPTAGNRPDGTPYSHDTRTVYSPGVGLEYRQWRHVSIRGEFEYQFWPHFLGHPNALTPSGFTVGATYAIRPFHKHGLSK